MGFGPHADLTGSTHQRAKAKVFCNGNSSVSNKTRFFNSPRYPFLFLLLMYQYLRDCITRTDSCEIAAINRRM